MSSSSTIASAAGLRAHVDAIAAVDADTEVDEATIQTLLAAAARLYCARVDRVGNFRGIVANALPATDCLTTASTLLRSVNIAPFELGLWEAWS